MNQLQLMKQPTSGSPQKQEKVEFWQELRKPKEVLGLKIGGKDGKKDFDSLPLEEQVYELGQDYNDPDTAENIVSSLVGKKILQMMKAKFEENNNNKKKIDIMQRTANIRRKGLAVTIEGKIKEKQKKMIEGFFTIMKNEIASTCDQARAIRKENMKRDAAERKLIAIIMLQE